MPLMAFEHLTVDKEIQFNQWLFDKLDNILSPQGFVVRANKPNKDNIFPNLCEYSTSKPDGVVYHRNSLQKTKITALTLHIESDSDESDVNVEDTDELALQLQQSMGLAIEVKVHKLNEAAINECFNNMFGAGSR